MTTTGRELRIALVMNGGVSLAVWMGGVTHELDLLRRAGDPDCSAQDVPDHDREVWRRWREALQGARVVVDVLAGSSAGGLNAAFLARAIASDGATDWADPDREHPYLRHLWEHGAALDTATLLRAQHPETWRSLFSGDYFEQMIGRTLRDLAAQRDGASPGDRRAPRPEGSALRRAVTLFTTGTALGPAAGSYADGFGQEFAVPDHRRLYRFRHDPDHVVYDPGEGFRRAVLDEFGDHPVELTRAVRASASFPAAFVPVAEVGAMTAPPVRIRPATGGGAALVMDGGVLDNAPFGPVLDSITRTPPDASLRRLLVYVVPSAGRPVSEPPPEQDPDWVHVVVAALGLPREADLRSDVEDLQALVDVADAGAQVQALLEAVLDPGRQDGPGAAQVVAAAESLLPLYRDGRRLGGIDEARSLAAAGERTRPHRLNGPIPSTGPAEGPAPAWTVGAGPVDLVAVPWGWGPATAERCARLLARDLRHRLERGEPVEAAAVAVSALLGDVEAVNDALERHLADLPAEVAAASDAVVVGHVNEVFTRLRIPDVVGDLLQRIATVHAGTRDGAGAADVLRAAFAVEVTSRALTARTPFARGASFEFLRLGPDVTTPLLPDLGVDPEVLGRRKLFGTRAGHFGAFGPSGWRTWDWRWGRLDAVAHLGRALGMDDGWVAGTQRAVLRSEGAAGTAPEVLTAGLERELLDLLARDDHEFLRDVREGLREHRPELAGLGDSVEGVLQRAAGVLADAVTVPHVPVPDWIERAVLERVLRVVLNRYVSGS